MVDDHETPPLLVAEDRMELEEPMSDPAEVAGRELEGACSPDTWNANPHAVKAMVDMFFEEEDEEIIAHAKSICAQCPVQQECLDTGMSERYGIRGGTTPAERKQLRKTIRLR